MSGDRLTILFPCLRASVVVLFLLIGAPLNAQKPRQAQLSWWDRAGAAQVGRYWIKTDLPNEEIQPIGQRLNLMYEQYAARMAHLPVRVEEQLNVFVFANRKDYEFTLRARFGLNAAGTGGMFFRTPVGGGLAFFTGGLPMQRVWHVMQHEGFHQFAWSRFGEDLPVWVNEGMAEFFGESTLIGDTLIIGQSNPRVIESVKKAITDNSYVPFDRMLSMRNREWSAALKENPVAGALQYQQSWSMVHFLVYGDGGKYVQNFETYLRHINNGLPAREAFLRSFGDDITAFENRWKDYALAAKPSAFTTAKQNIEFLAEGMLALSRRGVRPESIEALKTALRENQFTFQVKSHGMETTLSAADDSLFQIPRDDLNKEDEQPVFVVTKAKAGRMSVKERQMEETSPTPATITTENLRPKNLRIEWLRDPKDHELRFEIVVR